MAKKVLLIIAGQGYQPVEYNDTKAALEAAGVEVVTGSDASGQAYAADGSVAHVNVTLPEIDPELYDGIFLIGGPGAMENLDVPEVYNIMRKAADLGKAYGAICISSRILAAAGVITGRKATGWDGDNELTGVFDKHSVKKTDQECVVDELVVTATGPSAAQEFGEAIAGVL